MRRLGRLLQFYIPWILASLSGLHAEPDRASNANSTTRAPELITLEEAYKRTLATDQSIRIAYLEIRKARLLRWQSLARFEPRISGALGYGNAQEDRWRAERLKLGLSGSETSAGNKTSAKSTSDQSIFKDQSASETSLETFRAQDRFEEARAIRSNDFNATHTSRSSAAVILEQPLLDLTVLPAYRLGKLATLASQLQFQATVRDVLLGVARAYYDALKGEQMIAVSQETLALAEKQVISSQQHLDAGTALRTEVLRAQATAADARRTLAIAQSELASARELLRTTLHLPGNNFRLCDPPAIDVPPKPIAELLSQAFRQREDYRVQETSILQETERYNEIAAGYAPRVSAQLRARKLEQEGSANGSNSETRARNRTETFEGATASDSKGTLRVANPPGSPTIVSPTSSSSRAASKSNSTAQRDEHRKSNASSHFSSTDTEWEALLVVQMPLLGQRSLDLHNARYQITEAELKRDRLAATIEREVRDGVRQIETLSQTVKFLRTQVEAARQNYQDLQIQYEAGVATSIDLLIALRDLNNVRTHLVLDSYDAQFARCSLQRATGEFQESRVFPSNFENFSRSARPRP